MTTVHERTSVMVPNPVPATKKDVSVTATAAPSTPAPRAWKNDFSTTDLAIALVTGTAFVFLTLVDYSYDAFLYAQLVPHACTPDNPLVHALVSYHAWRIDGAPLLGYWELLMAALVPLIFLALLVDNFQTFTRRAPIGRHILDAESLVQLVLVVGVVATKVQPTTERILTIVREAHKTQTAHAPNGELYGEITNLVNAHFLVFGLNALQWFAPFLRLVVQRKQDAIRAREAQQATQLAARQAAAAERAAAKRAIAELPTQEEMNKRMDSAEVISGRKPSVDETAENDVQADESEQPSIKRRTVKDKAAA